jgi:hypothetical protein
VVAVVVAVKVMAAVLAHQEGVSLYVVQIPVFPLQ